MSTEQRAHSQRRTQAERTAATTQAIIAASRELFATKGYASTSIDDIVTAAGLTKGALYHHFSDKADVFRAVLKAEVFALDTQALALVSVSEESDPWKLLELSAYAVLDFCSDPGAYRIMFADAAGVIPWDELQEIRGERTQPFIQAVIDATMESGQMRRRPIKPITHLMFGAIRELAFMVARADDRDRVIRECRAEVAALLAATKQS